MRRLLRLDDRRPLVVICAFLLAALPILWVNFPPVMDFPNHLVRVWLLGGGAEQARLSSMYEVSWRQASTNLGVDVVAAGLARLLPIMTVSKILLLMMFLGPPLGCAVLHKVVFGRLHVWPIAFLSVAWTTTAIAGFMSYQIGLATALFCAAYVQVQGPRLTAGFLLAHVFMSTLLLLVHPFGLFFYLVLVSGIAVGQRLEMARLPAVARVVVVLGATSAVPVLLLFLLAPNPPGSHGPGSVGITWGGFDPREVLKTVLSPILTYDIKLDVIMSIPIAVLLVALLSAGKLRMHAGLLLASAVLFALTIVAPDSIGDASWLQRRLPLMASLLLLTGVQPDIQDARLSWAVTMVLLITTCIRVGWIGRVWIDRQQDFAEFSKATQGVEPGSSVISLQQDWADWHGAPVGRFMVGAPWGVRAVMRHYGALLVMSNHAFIPTLFAVPGQHALKVHWRGNSVIDATIPFPAKLRTPNRSDPYLKDWRQNFDYVVLLNADLATLATLETNGLQFVSGDGFAKLYRVKKSQ